MELKNNLLRVVFGIVLLINLSCFAFALTDLIAFQGNVQESGVDLDSGNLSVLIYDNSVGGNLIYSENFTDKVSDGKYDVMLGQDGDNGVVLDIEYGNLYYLDMMVNGEDFDYDGDERQVFQAGTGNISLDDLDFSDGENVTLSSGWFKGLFNWTVLTNWFSFDGAVLSFNESKLNLTISDFGVDAGFNSTYNSTYDLYAYNQTEAIDTSNLVPYSGATDDVNLSDDYSISAGYGSYFGNESGELSGIEIEQYTSDSLGYTVHTPYIKGNSWIGSISSSVPYGTVFDIVASKYNPILNLDPTFAFNNETSNFGTISLDVRGDDYSGNAMSFNLDDTVALDNPYFTFNKKVNVGGNITSTGGYFIGDGSYLTNLPDSGNASWNESYADTLYAGSEWAYNQTYSGSTYNETYDLWSYNQSLSTFSMWNSTWDNRALLSSNYVPYSGANSPLDLGNQVFRVNGTSYFDGGWQQGGVTIDDGDIFAQRLYVYNVTSLAVTHMNINGSLLPQFDEEFDIGSDEKRYKDLYLSNNAFINGTLYLDGQNISKWMYNQTYSGSTYNVTYDTWAYNMTNDTFNLYNSTWDNRALITGSYVPYSGATGNVDLGSNNLTASVFTADEYLANSDTYISVNSTSSYFPDGNGSRMMWVPDKYAFRAGRIQSGGLFGQDDTQWNSSNIGDYSFAAGFNPKALGEGSISIGYNARAIDAFCIALGFNAYASDTDVSGGAIAIGNHANASRFHSLALGSLANADGERSLALGEATVLSDDSIAIGSLTRAGLASGVGDYATAIGYNSTAGGKYSTALGVNVIASHGNSVVLGALPTECDSSATNSVNTCGLVYMKNLGLTTKVGEKSNIYYNTTSGRIQELDCYPGYHKLGNLGCISNLSFGPLGANAAAEACYDSDIHGRLPTVQELKLAAANLELENLTGEYEWTSDTVAGNCLRMNVTSALLQNTVSATCSDSHYFRCIY